MCAVQIYQLSFTGCPPNLNPKRLDIQLSVHESHMPFNWVVDSILKKYAHSCTSLEALNLVSLSMSYAFGCEELAMPALDTTFHLVTETTCRIS